MEIIIDELIDDLIASFREKGYDVQPKYCLSREGEIISIELIFKGRLA